MLLPTRRTALVLGAAALLAACSSPPRDLTDRSLKSIPLGFVADRNLTIRAADGSFELKPGEQFASPFQSDIWTGNLPDLTEARIVEGFATGLARGGRRVTVHVEGRDKPLYGVLVLSQVYGAAEGPGARSYQITVPADKIAAAYAGRTAVAYENVKFTVRWDTGRKVSQQWRSWVLWLSMTPL
jgi:hypothetical protein